MGSARVTEPQQRPSLLMAASRRVLTRGERLFSSGDAVESVFRVVRGRVRLERCLPDGRVVTVHVTEAGDLVAEGSLFGDRYHCDAVAEVRSTVEWEPRSELLERLAGDPRSLLRLCGWLSRQLREARSLLEIRNVRPARRRLVAYLRMRSAAGRPPRHRPVRLIADELGLAPETLYRLLAELEEAGEISRRGRTIELLPTL